MFELLAILVTGGVAALLSLGLRLLAPRWSMAWTATAAAAVVPALVLAFCAFIFFDASSTGPEQCGVDACGMAIMAAMFIGGLALLAFPIGWAAAICTLRAVARR
jgi:hypothetical protein